MKIAFSIMLLLANVAGAGTVDWSSDLCLRQKEFFVHQFQNRISVNELAQDVSAQSPSVILIGETHFESDNRYYPYLLEKLKRTNPQLDCVSFELNARDHFSREFGAERWQILSERAKALGLKTFKVDRCIPSQDVFHDFICLDGRNFFMSGRLRTLLRTGICHRILHVGGSMHLQNTRIGGAPNLRDRLEQVGISSYRIQLVDTAMELTKPGQSAFREDDSWVWGVHESNDPVCKEFPGVIRENFAFLNRGVELAKQVPVFHRKNSFIESQAWSDFDAALVLGCPDRGSDQCHDLPALPGYLNPD